MLSKLKTYRRLPRMQCFVMPAPLVGRLKRQLRSEVSLPFYPSNFPWLSPQKQHRDKLSLKLHYLPKDSLFNKRNSVFSSPLPGNLTNQEE